MDQDVKNEEQLNSTPLKAGGLVDPSILIILESGLINCLQMATAQFYVLHLKLMKLPLASINMVIYENLLTRKLITI